MTTVTSTAEIPKAPRWISTEAGEWAWREHDAWRGRAARALSVQERGRLLREAEHLSQTTPRQNA
ncbi:MAG TPA: hypothetical protein VF897_21010 [Roseiflexaceae bacterium]